MREITDQKKLRIWTLFMQWPWLFGHYACRKCCRIDLYEKLNLSERSRCPPACKFAYKLIFPNAPFLYPKAANQRSNLAQASPKDYQNLLFPLDLECFPQIADSHEVKINQTFFQILNRYFLQIITRNSDVFRG